MVKPSEEVFIPVVYSVPPPCVPSSVDENFRGWLVGCVNVYFVPATRVKDFFCSPFIT